MKTMKSMTEFVLLVNSKENPVTDTRFDKAMVLYHYAKFIQQKPELWMFIPCNEKGEPMEELGKPDYFLEYRGKGKPIASHNKRVEYQKAKTRCWFKGWILKEFTHPKRKGIQNSNKDGIILKEISSQTIESLITSRMELTMTETLIKKLGL